MKVSELAEVLELKRLTAGEGDPDVTGCYIGDLLSWVMSRAQEGDVWITVQTNVNVIAVAALAECACVLLPEGIEPDGDIIKKAEDKGISMFTSQKTGFELACRIGSLL